MNKEVKSLLEELEDKGLVYFHEGMQGALLIHPNYLPLALPSEVFYVETYGLQTFDSGKLQGAPSRWRKTESIEPHRAAYGYLLRKQYNER